jgi:hypothetical protein
VLFRAQIVGAAGGTAIFLHDPLGPSTVRLVGTGDGAPIVGGSLKAVAAAGVTDGDRAAVGAKASGGLAKTGVFLFDATAGDDKVVASNDLVPTDTFGPNSSYVKINLPHPKRNEGIGVDRSGTWVTYSAKVKDTVGTPSAAGVFRCEGT